MKIQAADDDSGSDKKRGMKACFTTERPKWCMIGIQNRRWSDESVSGDRLHKLQGDLLYFEKK